MTRCRGGAGVALTVAVLLAGCSSASPSSGPTGPAPIHPVEAPEDLPTATAPAAVTASATGYVIALNSHDARPGGDSGLHSANKRTRTYVTDDVYAVIADPPTRTAAREWAALTAIAATTRAAAVGVRLLPHHSLGSDIDVEVTYTVVTTAHLPSPASVPAPQSVVQRMTLTRHGDHWLVSRLHPG